jgi:hypothetical protein
MGLFDFIDALDEEGTKFKIREQFKIASEDAACTHILYAACHDPAYLSELVPFSGVRDKITLVQGAGWNSEFHQFNLNVTQFPTIFRWSELPVSAPANKVVAATAPKQKAVAAVQQKPLLMSGLSSTRKESWRRDDAFSVSDSAFGDLSPTDTNGFDDQDRVGWEDRSAYTTQKKGSPSNHPQKDSQLCKYFQKGFCRFGKKCNFQHIPKGLDGVNTSTPSRGPSSSQPDTRTTTSLLPAASIPGFIPLNSHKHRLDTVLSFPPPLAWKIYNTRFAKAKPCNAFHLTQKCSSIATCPFDHSNLEPEAMQVLEYVVRCNPCPRKGACRKGDCFYGHLCQREGCDGRSGSAVGAKACRFKAEMHYKGEECKVESLVPVEEEEGGTAGVGLMELLELDDGGEFVW